MSVELKDLAGQEPVLRQIEPSLGAGRLHHALLFMGPDGVGKLTAAKAVARTIFCQTISQRPRLESCGRCSACTKIDGAGHPDLFVFETEERMLKVDDMRDAIHSLQLRPIEAPLKMLLIRDADKLNPQSQNALLKTLEEPPGAAKIILTTAKPQLLILTLLSRCQRVVFSPVAPALLTRLVRERRGLDEATASLLAGLAQGSPASALSMDPGPLLEERNLVAEMDCALEPGVPRAAAKAIELARTLSEEKDQLPRRLELLALWIRDQLLLAGHGGTLANLDRVEDLSTLAELRGMGEILRRGRTIEHGRHLLSLPFNLNPALIVEQLLMSLAGFGPDGKRLPAHLKLKRRGAA